jgi:hypothetical protein
MAVSLSALLAPAPVQTNGRCAGNGWTVDTAAVARACERLQLRCPVRVHVARGRGGASKWGHHRFENGTHTIGVLAGATAEVASRTLWHELEHAVQRELHGEQYHPMYRAETRAVGYKLNRFEVAARRAERRHEVWFALVTA